MRITRIRCLPCRIPLRPERRMISSLGQHVVSEYPLVRVETDAGIDGVGEATVTAVWSGETVWGAQAIIERIFAPLLLGADPADVADIDRLCGVAGEDHPWHHGRRHQGLREGV